MPGAIAAVCTCGDGDGGVAQPVSSNKKATSPAGAIGKFLTGGLPLAVVAVVAVTTRIISDLMRSLPAENLDFRGYHRAKNSQ